MKELENDFIGYMTNLFKIYGFDAPTCKIIGILYLEPKDIAMDDIAKRTGYSLASVSNKMKLLENMGIVQRIKKPATKKVFFFMEKNIAKLNIKKIDAAISNIVSPAKEILPGILSKYKGKIKDDDSKAKYKIVEDYYQGLLQFEKILNVMSTELERLAKNGN